MLYIVEISSVFFDFMFVSCWPICSWSWGPNLRHNETRMSTQLAQRRWNLIGHVLRMPLEPPPQKISEFAGTHKAKGHRGRPRKTCWTTLKNDVSPTRNHCFHECRQACENHEMGLKGWTFELFFVMKRQMLGGLGGVEVACRWRVGGV